MCGFMMHMGRLKFDRSTGRGARCVTTYQFQSSKHGGVLALCCTSDSNGGTTSDDVFAVKAAGRGCRSLTVCV